MTTINSQDDFLEALRNNPRWRDAVRAQILGEDLLQLPVKFDAFVEGQSAQNKKFDTFVEEQSAQNKKFDAFLEEQSARTANLETRVGRIESDTGTLKGDFAGLGPSRMPKTWRPTWAWSSSGPSVPGT